MILEISFEKDYKCLINDETLECGWQSKDGFFFVNPLKLREVPTIHHGQKLFWKYGNQKLGVTNEGNKVTSVSIYPLVDLQDLDHAKLNIANLAKKMHDAAGALGIKLDDNYKDFGPSLERYVEKWADWWDNYDGGVGASNNWKISKINGDMQIELIVKIKMEEN